jgi:hypothetical protein
MLERVFADLLTPGEGVEPEVEDPGVRRTVRPFGVDGETAVVNDADGRELVPDRKLRSDWTGVGRTGDRDRPSGDELLVQLTGDRRRRLEVMRIELELAAKHHARSVSDRHTRAVDGRDARRSVCPCRSAMRPMRYGSPAARAEVCAAHNAVARRTSPNDGFHEPCSSLMSGLVGRKTARQRRRPSPYVSLPDQWCCQQRQLENNRFECQDNVIAYAHLSRRPKAKLRPTVA